MEHLPSGLLDAAPNAAHASASPALRVLHIGKYFPPYRGGMESFLADLVEQQRASGVDARAIVHGDPLPADPSWLVRIPVQVTLVFAPIALGFPGALWRMLREFKPDVIHLHMPNNAAFWALLLPVARRTPWVIHWHSDVLISRWDRILTACYQLYRPFEYKLLQFSEAILATSPPYMAASATLQPWLYKTIAIPLGLKPLSTAAETPGKAEITEWGDAKLRILSVGRLTYYKGFDTLISAVAGYPDVKLLIAGDGELRAELEAQVVRERELHGCANVELLGAVSEEKKHALFNSCDIFALASRERTEAFGLVLVEAMQHGKPCIVSDLEGSGMSWVVNQAEAGQCYAPDQVHAWKQAIEQCMASKHLLEQQGHSGRQAVQSQFTIAQCEQSIRNVYRRLLPRPQPRPQRRSSQALHLVFLYSIRDVQAAQAQKHKLSGMRVIYVDASEQADLASKGLSAALPIISLRDGLTISDLIAVAKSIMAQEGLNTLHMGPASGLDASGAHSPVTSAVSIAPRSTIARLTKGLHAFRLLAVNLSADTIAIEGFDLLERLEKSLYSHGAYLFGRVPSCTSSTSTPAQTLYSSR